MGFSQYLIPALAVASSVHAQCSTKGTLTITNTAQASALASCQTYSGSIAVQSKYAGDLAIDGPRKITGNLELKNVNKLTSLSSSNLQSIGGTWTIDSASSLGSLTFGELSAVKSIDFSNLGLPSLTSLSFDTGITEIDDLSITGTFLNTLEGISPTTAQSISLVANSALQNVTMQLTSITGGLIITGNIPSEIEITSNTQSVAISMPKLKSAGYITIFNASGISFPALEKSAGTVAFQENYVSSLSLPQLVMSQGFSVNGNPSLKSLSIPKYMNSTGSFSITNNTKLTGTLTFPSLEYVKGAPNFFGAFSGLDLPKLEHVNGGMNISSTKNIQKSVCNKYEKLEGQVINGKVHCVGVAPNTHTSPTEGSGYQGGSTGKGNSGGGKGAAGHVQASIALVFGAVVTIAAFMV